MAGSEAPILLSLWPGPQGHVGILTAFNWKILDNTPNQPSNNRVQSFQGYLTAASQNFVFRQGFREEDPE